MHRGIEFGDREEPIAAHEAALVTEGLEVGKHVADMAGGEMAIFTFENKQWRVLVSIGVQI